MPIFEGTQPFRDPLRGALPERKRLIMGKDRHHGVPNRHSGRHHRHRRNTPGGSSSGSAPRRRWPRALPSAADRVVIGGRYCGVIATTTFGTSRRRHQDAMHSVDTLGLMAPL